MEMGRAGGGRRSAQQRAEITAGSKRCRRRWTADWREGQLQPSLPPHPTPPLTGGIDDGVVEVVSEELLGGAGDGDTALALLLLTVHVEGKGERGLAQGGGLLLQQGQAAGGAGSGKQGTLAARQAWSSEVKPSRHCLCHCLCISIPAPSRPDGPAPLCKRTFSFSSSRSGIPPSSKIRRPVVVDLPESTWPQMTTERCLRNARGCTSQLSCAGGPAGGRAGSGMA